MPDLNLELRERFMPQVTRKPWTPPKVRSLKTPEELWSLYAPGASDAEREKLAQLLKRAPTLEKSK